MKNQLIRLLILPLLLVINFNSKAQNKYIDFDDACTKTANGSGYANNSRAVYASSFVVGEYVFLNNNPLNFKRLGSGIYHNPVTNSAFSVGLRGNITAIQACNVIAPSGTITKVNQFAIGITGDLSYQIDNGGSIYFDTQQQQYHTQFTCEPLPNNHVAVTTDSWGFGGTLKFKVENSPNWLTEAQLEAIDFSNMKGKDVSIYCSAFDNSNHITETRASVVHFAGDNTSKVPSFYKRSSTNRLPQLPYIFPNFSLTGKTNIIQFGQLDGSFNHKNQLYLNKGFNIVDKKTNNAIPNSQAIISNYDTWAYNHGCPRGNAAGATAWVASQSMSNLYSWFNAELIVPATGYGAVMVDFEAWYFEIMSSQDASNKMATLWRAFKQANPNVKLLSYVGSRGYAAGLTLSAINSTQRDAENIKYSQSASQVKRQFESKSVSYLNVNTGSPDGTTGYLSQYLDVINAGDYQHFLSHSWLYSTIQELELSKIHSPNKKTLALMWSYIEPVGGSDFETYTKYFKKSNNTNYYADFKPAAPFSYLYNHAAFATLLGDGIWFWHDPYASIEGFDYTGWSGKISGTGTHLPNNFSPNTGAFEISTTIGYDYAALALYEMSFNNDILTGTQPILKPEFSTNAGSSYYTGDNLLPASADFFQLPVVRMKKHPTLNEWLIVAVNRYNEMWNDQTIRVKIPFSSNTVDITLNGQFATIFRAKLN